MEVSSGQGQSLSSRHWSGAILGLALVFLWWVWVGQARPGSVSAPAGEAGLCLALVCWRAGVSQVASLALWMVGLLVFAAVAGVAPLWLFLAGWPAWLGVRAFASDRGFAGFILLAVALLTFGRCGAKLLLLAVPQSPLSLSAASLPSAIWAEAAANLGFLVLFSLLVGSGRGPSR